MSITSFPVSSERTKFYHDTRELMSAANFNLRLWNSNSSAVCDRAEADSVLDTDAATKVLGLRWNTKADTLCFPQQDISVVETVTKREILQHTSKNYDPLMTSYGAADYVYTPSTSALVMAKSRVAPLKTLTLPLLELMAAVIGSRLAKHVQKELQIDHVTLWSDSQIVLHWLSSRAHYPDL